MVFKDMGLIDFEEPFTRFYAHGLLIKEGSKMSKSKGNIVVPDTYIKKYGADTLRTYLMFLGPFNQGGDFYDSGIEGIFKFMNRVYRLVSSSKYQVLSDKSLDRLMHKTIKKVTDDMENLRYNTAVAHIMEYYNGLYAFYSKYKILDAKYCKTLLLLLAPFAPHMTEELFHLLNPKTGSIHLESWPKFDSKQIVEEQTTIVVQVNGKFRDSIEIKSEKIKDQNYIEKMAREGVKVQKHINGKKVKKVIYVEGKIINFVVN